MLCHFAFFKRKFYSIQFDSNVEVPQQEWNTCTNPTIYVREREQMWIYNWMFCHWEWWDVLSIFGGLSLSFCDHTYIVVRAKRISYFVRKMSRILSPFKFMQVSSRLDRKSCIRLKDAYHPDNAPQRAFKHMKWSIFNIELFLSPQTDHLIIRLNEGKHPKISIPLSLAATAACCVKPQRMQLQE